MVPPPPYDRWFILTVLALVGIGLLMVASASIVISDQQMHQPFYYFYRQLIYLILGTALGCVVIQVEISVWEKASNMLLAGAMLLLALVLFPKIGHSVNGSVRWIGLGIFSIQVSEFAKLAVIIYMAAYLVHSNLEVKTSFTGFLKPMLLLAVVSLLLLREPDFGACVVIISTVLGMMFLAGMQLRHFTVLLLGVLGGLVVLAISAPYRMHRLTSFLNPWENPFSSGYQLTQSLIAFGRGGWFGVGLGKSIQKMFYLPEAHTDFLFAVIAEELGLIGLLVVVALFAFLVIRILLIGRRAQRLGQHFAGYLAYGFGLWIVIQFAVNMGVNVGLLPTKGLTLPLMSYGGSSMLVNCITIAILLRIEYENRMVSLGLR
ncbi:MAG: putative lipid II flippase FtsW [Gammaproteobacteria bacterium]|nr:putative lipid II flippase FtsW [Gammaproteobacteria bacterium]